MARHGVRYNREVMSDPYSAGGSPAARAFNPQAGSFDEEEQPGEGQSGPTEADSHGAEAALLEAQVSRLVAGELAIESVEAPEEPRRDGVIVVRGRLLRPSAEVFARWLRELNLRGYTPLLRPDPAREPGRVLLRVMQGVGSRAPSRLATHVILFVLTILSTLFVGAQLSPAAATISSMEEVLDPRFILQGWPFAATLLVILTAHEFGHYFAARYHKVAVTLPYFIPLPVGFGTMGAFIQTREPVRDRRQLFDIGVAGPLAGLVLAVPLLFVGLSGSEIVHAPAGLRAELVGNSLLYWGAKYLVFGQPLPNLETGALVGMSPVTFAAWVGLLVTAINLLPVSQLDGGHTVFALFGERARIINWAALGMMAVLGLAGLGLVQDRLPALQAVGYTGWLIWLFLIFFIIGPYHPPALDDVTPLDGRRRLVGFLVIVIFILVFVPVPFRLVTF